MNATRPMKTLAVAAQKGGAGKTTIAVHLAVSGALAGEIAELFDCDPQGSAVMWGKARGARGGKAPRVTLADPADLPRLLADARRRGVTLAVIDTAPRLDTAATRVAKLADFILIPCRPSAFDFAAAAASAKIVKTAGAAAAFVLSACPFRAPEIADAREALAGYGIPLCPVEVTERRAYSRAITTGHAVAEFEPHGKAAAEMAALWKFSKGALANGK